VEREVGVDGSGKGTGEGAGEGAGVFAGVGEEYTSGGVGEGVLARGREGEFEDDSRWMGVGERRGIAMFSRDEVSRGGEVPRVVGEDAERGGCGKTGDSAGGEVERERGGGEEGVGGGEMEEEL
jgi:hypothetical protein